MRTIDELEEIAGDDEKPESARTKAFGHLRAIAVRGTLAERQAATEALWNLEHDPLFDDYEDDSPAYQFSHLEPNSRGLLSQTYGCGGGRRTLPLPASE